MSEASIASQPTEFKTLCTPAEAAAAATRFEMAANKIDLAANKITDIANKFDNYFLPSVSAEKENVNADPLAPHVEELEKLSQEAANPLAPHVEELEKLSQEAANPLALHEEELEALSQEAAAAASANLLNQPVNPISSEEEDINLLNEEAGAEKAVLREGQERQDAVSPYKIKEVLTNLRKYINVNEQFQNNKIKPYDLNYYVKKIDLSQYDNYFLFLNKADPRVYIIGKNMIFFHPNDKFPGEYPPDKNNDDQIYQDAVQFDSIFGYIYYASIEKLKQNYYFIWPIIDFVNSDNNHAYDVDMYETLSEAFDILQADFEKNPTQYEKSYDTFLKTSGGNSTDDEIKQKLKIPNKISRGIGRKIKKTKFSIKTLKDKIKNLFTSSKGGRRTKRRRSGGKRRRTRRISKRRTRRNSKKRISKRRKGRISKRRK